MRGTCSAGDFDARLDFQKYRFQHSLFHTGNKLNIHRAVIMSNNNDQLKFSELSVDMFRMVHMLEYQQEIFKSCPDDPSRMRTCENPQKCLLFQPDISKFMLFISGAYDEVGVDGALFVYLSAVGVESIDLESHPDGLKMSAGECLFYTDLITFTRNHYF